MFLEVVGYRWGYSDRGVLFGPWCSVYGVGTLFFLLCIGSWLRQLPKLLQPVLVFLPCMSLTTTLELATTYLLEFLTESWPWQTYCDYKINFQGRIALSPSLRFGLGGVLFLYLLQPAFEWLTDRIPEKVRPRLFGALFGVFLADCAVTVLTKLL